MAKGSKCVAYVEFITLTLFHITVAPGVASYALPFAHDLKRQKNYVVLGFPILRWSTGGLWDEANLWLGALAQSIPTQGIRIKSIRSLAYALITFMRFVESEGRPWNYLPLIPADRTINRYRKHLIDARESGELAPSTVSAKMSVVLRLFRWAQINKIISAVAFEITGVKVVKVPDQYGRELAVSVSFSNLAIPNRKASADRVEGGLMPVSIDYRNELIDFARDHLSYDLYLMLRVAFESGLRIESICNLKVNTVNWGTPDFFDAELSWLQVGPNVDGAPVATKFGVQGAVMIGTALLDELKEYCKSIRRITRENRASEDCGELLFITKNGNSYGRRSDTDRSAINSLVFAAKEKARKMGLNFDDFHFHRARATFGVAIVQCGMECEPSIPLSDILSFARDCLLHKDVETTMKYVRFLQNSKIKAKYANEYTAAMMGRYNERSK